MSETTEERYQVYLYDLPKIDDEGKSIPGEPAQTREFSRLDEAQNFAADRKGDFDRIVLIRTSGDEQKLIERFRDAERIVPEATA